VSDWVPGYIGVDIGGTNLRGAVVRSDGEIQARFRLKSSIADGSEVFIKRLSDEIDGLITESANLGVQVQGLGVGIPGLIGADGLIHSSVNLKPLEGLNLSETLSTRLKLPVVAANDANLIALAEARFGAGKGMHSLVVITIGTGLGSGLILDQKIWSGVGGFASELGHITVDPEGFDCPCGNRGCLEQYVSAGALSRFGGGLSPETLALKARVGDPYACAAFDKLGYWLGTALASLLNTLNIQGVIIGGGVAASYDLFERSLYTTMCQRSFTRIFEQVTVCRATLGDDAGLFGGALLAAENGL